MKTIEERAEEYASLYQEDMRHFIEEWYTQGATEQAEITKQEMIEKACNVYADLLSAHGYNPIDVNNEVVRMKKELEE